MKQKIAMILAALLLLSGCGGNGAEEEQETSTSAETSVSEQEKETKQDQEDAEEEVELPGTYTVPEGWVKYDGISSSGALFYVQEGQEDQTYPDNIAISVGSDPYSLEEHDQFREAITQQLLMQLNGMQADLKGDGTQTAQDYVLYTFTIDEGGIITKQYYIVDDYRFCLVHLTNFTRSESADQAAQTIVDSFVWTTESEQAENAE